MARIAFVLGDQYEDSELRQPYDEAKKAGHEVVVVGVQAGQTLQGKKGKDTVRTDAAAKDVDPGGFDALVVPGGQSPDKIRTDADVVKFVRAFFDADKPVAAICHAASLLIEADAVRGRTLTSWPSVKTDVRNAGGTWVDREVCEDGSLITSRKPDDLPAFCKALLDRVGAGMPR